MTDQKYVYRTVSYSRKISRYTFVKETDKCIFFMSPHYSKPQRVSKGGDYFFSYAEARAKMEQRLLSDVERYSRALQWAQKVLAEMDRIPLTDPDERTDP